MNCSRYHVVAIASISVGLFAAAQGHAAGTKVNQSDWWGGITGFPSYVNMYIYVSKSPATKPPILVVPHHCGGDATSSFNESSGLVSLADSSGFVMIFPEATGQNCWDAGSDRSLSHSGKGDAPAIVQMVKYTLAKYGGDASRVYSEGGSSGGIMTEALLGVFPDVFMAGVSIMGVPCGCWATGYNDVVGKPSDGTGQWSGPCQTGSVDNTGAEWGALVRSYFPGYTGHRPRLQHWHGTKDTTINYKNLAEDIQEWTNLLGLSEAPTGSDKPKSDTTRQYWKNSCGYTVYETFSIEGAGHTVSVDAATIATYFGLSSKTTTVDPEAAACPTGGASGTGGATSAGGATGAGGSAATGGKSGSATVTGGRSGVSTGGVQSTGGAQSTGGQVGAGGSAATGGRVTAGGNTAARTGGSMNIGGAVATGGTSASSSTNTGGSAAQTGGAHATGGSFAQTSTASNATGGMANTGGIAAQAGDSSAVASTNVGNPSSDGGCSCTVLGRASNSAPSAAAVLLAVLGLTLRRKARRN
jgi:acetylxylan esterase